GQGPGLVVSGSTFTDLTTGVAISGQGVVVKNSTFDQVADFAVNVTARPFDPVDIIEGNVATNSGVNGVYMHNPVFADGARLFGRPGWGLVLSNTKHHADAVINVPDGVSVGVPAGAVVKFRHVSTSFGYPDDRGGLRVAGELRVVGDAGSPAVLTSWRDDEFGGDT